ncbi:MAG: hypothetical protein AB2L24_29980 [Mangrovibacterium sp.]
MKSHFYISALGVIFIFLLVTQCKNNDVLPEKWLNAWSAPAVSYRPLQMVHGADIRDKASYYKDTCGLGGVVCNVPFGDNYLQSEKDWTVYVEGVKEMLNSGLRVWIYDEDGYPSLGAGGRVLEADPSLEALEMVYDKDSKKPFTVRSCYEYTHACNNYYVARRYPNPLNPKSAEKFIELTHQAYFDHLGAELYGKVEAFFTDEPSMMAVNLGELPEFVRKDVKVTDPLDITKKNLPMISWVENLPEKYKEKYGEDLIPVIGSLFSGNEEKDKVVRQKFWSLLAEMDRKYYYDAIRDWCKTTRGKNSGKGPVSSGHGLREENPANHVSLDGNKLLASSGFDIPGLDQLSSDPTIWGRSSWMAAFFPNSAAIHTGKRRVMCEMSDFDQTLNGKAPATLQQMQAATAWQMAFGVTDFNVYYTINYGDKYPYRRESAHKEYCDFVGRVNSLIMEADPVRKVLLYYPIYDLQREYIPTAGKMHSRTQNEQTRILETSFRELGSNLLKSQTQFVLVDYLMLGQAMINENKTIQIGRNQYSSIIFPKGIVLPPSVSNVITLAKEKGIKILFADDFDETPDPGQLLEFTGDEEKFTPAYPEIAFGKFTREGREIYVMVNTGRTDYSGVLEGLHGTRYIGLDPQTGEVSKQQKLLHNQIDLKLASLQTKILVTFTK